ncbi:glutamate 5-kinase [Mucilaginibacter lacusdianchii]|uniref:glutamate 5-kinase n=1 Tax=Mucilaginibacter lacusdianchii TaxID=2684211 RepID=UPI00131C8B51|nr:glutamate 5-kinase [Mucilaginibacter sp. JXJ CY 39]
MSFNYQRVVVKVGSNVLTQPDGLPDINRISHLVEQLTALKKQGIEVILVSSGAVASGRSLIQVTDKVDSISARQLLASIGQVKLINTYARLFEQQQLLCSQVLVTKEDFRDRVHYLNMKNCLEILLQHQVIPIVNENDVVSVTELMFTDNDELAGLVASMLNADALIILTNVNGIYTGDPKLPTSVLLEEITDADTNFSSFVSTGKSQFGRGGMITKSTMAQKVAQLGIAVHIANGTVDGILEGVLQNTIKHTRFKPQKSKSGKKKWIAHAVHYATGAVQMNEGAKLALLSTKATSLLPVGLIAILTDFKKGDIIKLLDENNNAVGQGIAEYGSDKARERLGQKNQKPLVHYDYLYLNH